MPEKEASLPEIALLSLDQHFRKATSIFALYLLMLLMMLLAGVLLLSSRYRRHVASRKSSRINQQLITVSDILEHAYFTSWDNMTRKYSVIPDIARVFSYSPTVVECNYDLADARPDPELDLVWISACDNPFGMGRMVLATSPADSACEGVFSDYLHREIEKRDVIAKHEITLLWV